MGKKRNGICRIPGVRAGWKRAEQSAIVPVFLQGQLFPGKKTANETIQDKQMHP